MHHPTDRITFYSHCYTSCGALAGTRNSLMGPPGWVDAITLRHHEQTLSRATSGNILLQIFLPLKSFHDSKNGIHCLIQK